MAQREVFKKQVSAQGVNGTYHGEVIITMNDKSEIVKGTHAVTHDDYEKTVWTHKVESIAAGTPYNLMDKLASEGDVEKAVRLMEPALEAHLKTLADRKPELSFTERLKHRGYKQG